MLAVLSAATSSLALGDHTSSISLAPALATQKKRAPPGSWRGNLLQITRPEQPLASVRKAHIYYHVLFSPIATNDLADQTSALLYPVVVGHLNSHSHVCILRLHNQGTHSRW